jgi:hypothetical protein
MILRQVKEVMNEYQIKIEKCSEEKDTAMKENNRLRNQLEKLQRRAKRA